MKIKTLIFALLTGLFTLNSCSDDDTQEDASTAGEIKTYEFLDARSYTDWVYFSFSKGEIVTVTDYQNDTSWDIAFHRGDVRLNGGASGIGEAEAINTNKTEWNDITAAPTSGYTADEIGTITTAFTGSGIETEEQPFSQTLATWLTIDVSNPPPVYVVHNYIYVVKSASGKYVKLQLYDNKNETNAAGYVSFKYQHNTEGGTNF